MAKANRKFICIYSDEHTHSTLAFSCLRRVQLTQQPQKCMRINNSGAPAFHTKMFFIVRLTACASHSLTHSLTRSEGKCMQQIIISTECTLPRINSQNEDRNTTIFAIRIHIHHGIHTVHFTEQTSSTPTLEWSVILLWRSNTTQTQYFSFLNSKRATQSSSSITISVSSCVSFRTNWRTWKLEKSKQPKRVYAHARSLNATSVRTQTIVVNRARRKCARVASTLTPSRRHIQRCSMWNRMASRPSERDEKHETRTQSNCELPALGLAWKTMAKWNGYRRSRGIKWRSKPNGRTTK